MRIRPSPGLTFDDVLLVPRHSRIAKRSDVSTRTSLCGGIDLALPILSANMDTITEADMAIAMARAGGVGVLHRFMDIDRQVDHIVRVKRSMGFVVEDPLTIKQEATIAVAKEYLTEVKVGGLIVVDDDHRVLGILTKRDVILAIDGSDPVSEVMTPREKLVVSDIDTNLDDARTILHDQRLEKLPLVDEDDRLRGLITAQDITKLERFPQATKDSKGRLCVGVAIGAHEIDLERAQAGIEAGADIVVVDIAHGHSENCIQMVRQLKKRFPEIPLIAGNVATPEGVRDLASAGADAIKVGIGPGSICVTRVVTGFGVPQLTAILDCAEIAHEIGLPIIADGGIRDSGDIVKALAAGANAVMIGGLLAGTDEAPGAAITRDGRKYKVVRGMASLTANIDRRLIDQGAELELETWERVVPEGIEAVVVYRGSVEDILRQLIGGLRSGMSYAGAETIEQLWERAEFIRITPAGSRESGPHDVTPLGYEF